MEWRMHRTVERQAIRLQKMMDRLNVDAVALVRMKQGDVYAKARSTCLFCQESDVCLRWLDQPETDQCLPVFCPLMDVFNACRKASHFERTVA